MRTSTSSIMLLPAALTFLSAISAAVVPSAPIQCVPFLPLFSHIDTIRFSDTLTALLTTSDTTSIPPSKDLRKRMIMPDSRLFCIALPMLVIVSETWLSPFTNKKSPAMPGFSINTTCC